MDTFFLKCLNNYDFSRDYEHLYNLLKKDKIVLCYFAKNGRFHWLKISDTSLAVKNKTITYSCQNSETSSTNGILIKGDEYDENLFLFKFIRICEIEGIRFLEPL